MGVRTSDGNVSQGCYAAIIVDHKFSGFVNPNSRTDRHTLLEPTLADRSVGEETIESIVIGVHTIEKQPRPKKLGNYNSSFTL